MSFSFPTLILLGHPSQLFDMRRTTLFRHIGYSTRIDRETLVKWNRIVVGHWGVVVAVAAGLLLRGEQKGGQLDEKERDAEKKKL